MKVKFTVTGLKECEEALAELTRATGRNVLKRALLAASEPVASAAASQAPVRTGKLKVSIGVSRTAKSPTKRGQAQVYIGSTGSFGHLVEFGTGHQAPQPFMRPALDSNRDKLFSTFKDTLRIEVDKTLARHRKKQAKLAKSRG